MSNNLNRHNKKEDIEIKIRHTERYSTQNDTRQFQIKIT